MDQKTSVLQWDCNDVFDWASQIVGENNAAILKHEKVDGPVLLEQTEASLRGYGMTGAHATTLCLATKDLQGVRQQVHDMHLDSDYRTKLDTHDQLQIVWDVIGTSTEERQAFLNELSHSVQTLYHNKLQEQRDARETCEEKIRGLQAAMANLCEQLQVEQPEPVSATIPLLQQIELLTEKLDIVKQEKERQHARNGKALAELAHLYSVLGEHMPDTQHLHLGAHRLGEIQTLIAQTHQKIADKKTVLETAKAKVHACLQELCFSDDELTELDRAVLLNGQEIPLSALGALARRGSQLEETIVQRKAQLKALAKKIGDNWMILGTPAEHRSEFMKGDAGLGQSTFRKCQIELAELEAAKKEQLPSLLEKSREELLAFWAETSYPPANQEEFNDYYDGLTEEHKLDALREQIVEMKKRQKDMEPLLALVAKREEIKAEEVEYMGLQNDPKRFKIPGLPLQLERMRKDFHGFPKLVAKLQQEVLAWEAVNGPFLQNGERLLTTMENLGEFVEGYLPGGGEPRRSATLKVESPNKPARNAVRPTPGKREERKAVSQSMPCAMTPSKREAAAVLVASARKRPILPPPMSSRKIERPTPRKNDRENVVGEQPARGAEAKNEKTSSSSSQEQPSHSPKRLRTPLKESNHS